MHLHERLDCIHHVNAKWFVKVSALNRIQHEEKETIMTSRENSTSTAALQISRILVPSHHPFLIASSFYVLEAVKNWTVGRPGNV